MKRIDVDDKIDKVCEEEHKFLSLVLACEHFMQHGIALDLLRTSVQTILEKSEPLATDFLFFSTMVFRHYIIKENEKKLQEQRQKQLDTKLYKTSIKVLRGTATDEETDFFLKNS